MSGVDLNTGECDGHAAAKVRWPATAHVDSRHPEGAR
jgi:hypothetical protein